MEPLADDWDDVDTVIRTKADFAQHMKKQAQKASRRHSSRKTTTAETLLDDANQSPADSKEYQDLIAEYAALELTLKELKAKAKDVSWIEPIHEEADKLETAVREIMHKNGTPCLKFKFGEHVLYASLNETPGSKCPIKLNHAIALMDEIKGADTTADINPHMLELLKEAYEEWQEDRAAELLNSLKRKRDATRAVGAHDSKDDADEEFAEDHRRGEEVEAELNRKRTKALKRRAAELVKAAKKSAMKKRG